MFILSSSMVRSMISETLVFFFFLFLGHGVTRGTEPLRDFRFIFSCL